MGRIGVVQDVLVTDRGGVNFRDITVDRGGDDNRTVHDFRSAGDDSAPLPGDYSQTVQQPGAGRDSNVGYVDANNALKSEPGEKRIYARDPSSGVSVCEIWLQGDGSVEISNSTGTVTLQSSGNVTINGVNIAVDGTITTPTRIISPSAVIDGKELANHPHPAGTPPGNTGPNQ